MQNRIHYFFHFITLICLIGVIYLLVNNKKEKTAFFLSAEVYNEFAYKKELEVELQNTQNRSQHTIDSLEMDLNTTLQFLQTIQPTQEQVSLYEKKQQNYFEFRNQIEQGYSAKTQDFYNQIWDRINEYVQEYGKENGYTYIYGANGDGSIMYAEDSKEITEEIITMINARYAGE